MQAISRHRRAWRQTPDQDGPAVHPGRFESHRKPDVHLFFHAVGRRQIDAQVRPRDADDLDVEVVDDEVPADDVGVALESALPQLVADYDAHDDKTTRILLADKHPAESYRPAQQRQHVVRDAGSRRPFHHAFDFDHRVAAFGVPDVGDGTTREAHVEHRAWQFMRARDVPRVRLDRDDPARVWIWQ